MVRIHQHAKLQAFLPHVPCILKKMPRNLKLTSFTNTKYIYVVPKGRKFTDHDQNLNRSEGGQDTSACKISCHSLHVHSRKYPHYPAREIWPVSITVFEIASWTGARDQQKQQQSSKTTVFAGPKHQQFKFCILEIHISPILFQTRFKVQNSLMI